MMAVPTLLIGLLPTYASIGLAAPLLLLLMRVIQGAAVGGEVPGAWVFVSEHVPAASRGLRLRHADGGPDRRHPARFAGGDRRSTPSTRRRKLPITPGAIPFLLGGVFGLVAMYLRRWLHETPVFAELQQRKALADRNAAASRAA